MEQEKTPERTKVGTMILTGDVYDRIDEHGNYIYGDRAVKVTIEIAKSCRASEALIALKDIFQRTIQSFEQFV